MKNTTDEDIRRLLKAFIKVPVQVFPAKVNSVNVENYTVDVKPVGGAELFDVRLKAGVEAIKDGVVEIPKVGSMVLVGLVGNDKDTAFLVRTSEVDEVIVNGGQNGGVPRVQAVVSDLNQIKQDINMLKTLVSSWVPVPTDGGASLKSFVSAWSAQMLTMSQASNIENSKFKQ